MCVQCMLAYISFAFRDLLNKVLSHDCMGCSLEVTGDGPERREANN
jgi:hypothetical protein